MPRRSAGSAQRKSGSALRALGGVLAALLAVGIFLAGGPSATAAANTAHPGRGYYLALGDSLSQGVQPATPPLPPGTTLGESIETDQGYADDLYTHYKQALPGPLTLVKLGCPGETTGSMRTGAGSPCTYSGGSQLAAALAFIAAHKSGIKLITIDIGANNVDDCATGTTINQACVARGIAAAKHDLPLILGALRRAAGKHAVIVGMNLYDPFLAEYLTGPAGQSLAKESVTLSVAYSKLLRESDRAFGIRTADVQGAFLTTDFSDTASLPGVGTVPVNVARICDWTWMCAPSPVGPNIHANATGYRVIARAFERAIGWQGRRGR